MRIRLMLAAAALFTTFGMARADTISTFNLSAVLTDGSAVGTLTLNETTGKFTASTINVVTSNGSTTYSGAPTSSTSGSNYVTNIFATSSSAIYDFDLVLPLSSLIGYSGGSLCTSGALCSGRESSVQILGLDTDPVTAGTLKLVPPVAVTPEPSGLLLLGTGVLVIGSFMRRQRI